MSQSPTLPVYARARLSFGASAHCGSRCKDIKSLCDMSLL